MDVIRMARDLGAALQQSEPYKAYLAAQEKADQDGALQEMIDDFNEKKFHVETEMKKADKDQASIEAMTKEANEVYYKIMEYPLMQEYNDAKAKMDRILDYIQQIIVYSANGEDPETIQEAASSCGGSCSSCAGCH